MRITEITEGQIQRTVKARLVKTIMNELQGTRTIVAERFYEEGNNIISLRTLYLELQGLELGDNDLQDCLTANPIQ